MTHVTHDPWVTGAVTPYSASVTQSNRLPGTVFGHCICTHTFKLLHNCTCTPTAHTGTCKFSTGYIRSEPQKNVAVYF